MEKEKIFPCYKQPKLIHIHQKTVLQRLLKEILQTEEKYIAKRLQKENR